jgi:hypothetical protein
MKAKVTRIKTEDANRGGIFYYIFFKCEDGKSARTSVVPGYGNYIRWEGLIKKFREPNNKEIWIDKWIWKNEAKRHIDADSRFEMQTIKGEEREEFPKMQSLW